MVGGRYREGPLSGSRVRRRRREFHPEPRRRGRISWGLRARLPLGRPCLRWLATSDHWLGPRWSQYAVHLQDPRRATSSGRGAVLSTGIPKGQRDRTRSRRPVETANRHHEAAMVPARVRRDGGCCHLSRVYRDAAQAARCSGRRLRTADERAIVGRTRMTTESEPFTSLDRLVDGWCQRRALRPLSIILRVYPMTSPLSDGWHELRRALRDVRCLGEPHLTDPEAEVVESALRSVERALGVSGWKLPPR